MIDLVQSVYQSALAKAGKDFAQATKPYAVRHAQDVLRLKMAVAEGNKSAIRSAQYRLLNSLSSKVACLVRALPKDHGRSITEVAQIAAELNSSKDCGEKVFVWMKPKSFGDGFRPICSFGPKRKSLHILLADVLRAKFDLNPWDYMVKGRGNTKLVENASKAIIAGNPWVFVADIKDFFRSVQPTQLDKIVGLPKSVLENCLSIPSKVDACVFSMPVPHQLLEGAVLGGIPQGSGVSGLVASMLFGTWLEHIAPTGQVFLYADDIMVVAGSKLQAEALEKSFAEYLSNHPQGPFQLKRSDVVHANDGFDFCGYRYRGDPFENYVHISPAQLSFARLKKNVMDIARDHSMNEGYELMKKALKLWAAGFPSWKMTDQSWDLLWSMADEVMNDVYSHGYEWAMAWHFPSSKK